MNIKFIAIPAIALAAGLGLAACGSQSASHAAAPAVTHSAAAAPTHSAAPAVQSGASWLAGPGGQAARAVSNDLTPIQKDDNAIAADASNENATALTTDATTLGTDASTWAADIQTALDSPAPPAGAASFHAALIAYQSSAASLVKAAGEMSIGDYSDATSDTSASNSQMSIGTADLNAATNQIKS